MRQGYAEIRRLRGWSHLRPMRGDNYCAVRATVFQLLTKGLDMQQQLGNRDDVIAVSATVILCHVVVSYRHVMPRYSRTTMHVHLPVLTDK